MNLFFIVFNECLVQHDNYKKYQVFVQEDFFKIQFVNNSL